ncbi:MAG TPA: PKD domain-containing protein, partial [Verrucomicrobiae bacterium]|nr:PKD domain-containing protein [Verrucomicrobiae bacterium]
MRYVSSSAAAAVAFLMLAPSVLSAQGGSSGLSITNYQMVSEERYTRTQWYMTYKADLVNTGAPRQGVTATVASTAPSVVVVAGQGTLHFGPVPANGRVTSSDTFTILVDRSVTFDFGYLVWSFLNPVANPGADQTVPVGTIVTVNGSGSTNPSGIGSLTYSWAMLSVPSGSHAALQNSTTVSPSFTVDTPGTYTVQLTVSNGVASDSATVRVSTVNSPPVANAGPNQTVAVGSLVTLNGSASYDVDGDSL